MLMSLPERLVYRVKAEWDGETGAEVSFREHPSIRLDMDSEFGGLGRYPCPDEVFASSIAGCLTTTFLYFTRKMGLKLKGMSVEVEMSVVFRRGAGYRISGADVKMKILVPPGETDKALSCAKLAERYCHITASISECIPIRFNVEVSEA